MNLSGGAATIAFQVINPANGQAMTGTARIDTGADVSVIDSSIPSLLGAQPAGYMLITGVNSVPTLEPVYNLDINLGASGYVAGASIISDANLSQNNGYDLLIGVDILQSGELGYDGLDGTFTLQVGIGPGQPVTAIPDYLLYGGIGVALLGIAGALWIAGSEVKRDDASFVKGFEAASARGVW